MNNETPTRAAGGIVCRVVGGRSEILLVHRPKYDDWSLPKGHVDSGETALEAAVREVREETGYDCDPTQPAGTSHYRTRTGAPKVVEYWVMAVAGGDFHPNDEVDQIAWASLEDALEMLTYAPDRELVRRTLEP